MTTAPYPWTHPDLVRQAQLNSRREPMDVVREHVAKTLQLPTGSPVPWMLIIPVHYTRPGATPDQTLNLIEFSPRVPTSVRHMMTRILRQDSTVDIIHARYRSRYEPFIIICDALLRDDCADAMHRIPEPPPHPLSRAIQREAKRRSVPVRHWHIPHGAEAWQSMRREQHAFDALHGVTPGTNQQLLNTLAQMAPQDWIDYLDRAHERTTRGETP